MRITYFHEFPESSELARHNGLQILANLKRQELFTDFQKRLRNSVIPPAPIVEFQRFNVQVSELSRREERRSDKSRINANSEDLLER